MVSGVPLAARATDEAGNERMEEQIECRSGIIYEGEIGSLRRGSILAEGGSSRLVWSLLRFVLITGGRIGAPGTFNGISQPT